MRYFVPVVIIFVMVCCPNIPLQGATDPPPTMTNESIVQLVAWGFNSTDIIKKIGSVSTQFDLSTAGIAYLTDNGVTDRILDAMFQASVRNVRDGMQGPSVPAPSSAAAPSSTIAPTSAHSITAVAPAASTRISSPQRPASSTPVASGNLPGATAPEMTDLTADAAPPRSRNRGQNGGVGQTLAPTPPANQSADPACPITAGVNLEFPVPAIPKIDVNITNVMGKLTTPSGGALPAGSIPKGKVQLCSCGLAGGNVFGGNVQPCNDGKILGMGAVNTDGTFRMSIAAATAGEEISTQFIDDQGVPGKPTNPTKLVVGSCKADASDAPSAPTLVLGTPTSNTVTYSGTWSSGNMVRICVNDLQAIDKVPVTDGKFTGGTNTIAVSPKDTVVAQGIVGPGQYGQVSKEIPIGSGPVTTGGGGQAGVPLTGCTLTAGIPMSNKTTSNGGQCTMQSPQAQNQSDGNGSSGGPSATSPNNGSKNAACQTAPDQSTRAYNYTILCATGVVPSTMTISTPRAPITAPKSASTSIIYTGYDWYHHVMNFSFVAGSTPPYTFELDVPALASYSANNDKYCISTDAGAGPPDPNNCQRADEAGTVVVPTAAYNYPGKVTKSLIIAGIDVAASSSANPEARFFANGSFDVPFRAANQRISSPLWGWGYARLDSIAQPGAVSGISNVATYVKPLTSATPDQIVQSGEAELGIAVQLTSFDRYKKGYGVDSASIVSAGSGQTDGTYTIPAQGGGGSGALVQITISHGTITAAYVINAGSGYTSSPTFTVSKGGTPGVLTASVEPVYRNSLRSNPLTLSLIAGGGFITPLSENQASPTIYVTSTQAMNYWTGQLGTPQAGNAKAVVDACNYAMTQKPPTPCYLAYIPESRSRFYRNWQAGFRVKDYYFNRWNDSYDFPGSLDVTVGQNEYVTGGVMSGFVVHLGGQTPIHELPGVRIFGSVDLVASKNQLSNTFALQTAPNTVMITDQSVAQLFVQQPNRDRYRFGFGLDLVTLIKKLNSGAAAATPSNDTNSGK